MHRAPAEAATNIKGVVVPMRRLGSAERRSGLNFRKLELHVALVVQELLQIAVDQIHAHLVYRMFCEKGDISILP